MTVFHRYAQYYDLLYRDKDYASEIDYIVSLIREYAPDAETILDLGCGSGIHAAGLFRRGYDVHGVDASRHMIACASDRRERETGTQSGRLSFSCGDIRDYRTDRSFDVVTALFHVMSYQIADEDILRAIETAGIHLNPGGIFIFDCWHGPAVLALRPESRIKKMEDDTISVVRTAQPVMHPRLNSVDVQYHITVRHKDTGSTEEIEELHRMRYLFTPEITSFLSSKNFSVLRAEEWLTRHEPGPHSWSVCYVAAI